MSGLRDKIMAAVAEEHYGVDYANASPEQVANAADSVLPVIVTWLADEPTLRVLREAIDDSALTHIGRSLGDQASERVARDGLAALSDLAGEDVAAPPIDPPDGDDTWRPDEVGLRDEIAVLLERGPGDLDERLERSRALADTIMPVVLAHIGAVLTEEREPRPVRQSPAEVLALRLYAACADGGLPGSIISEPGVWSLALSLIDALAAHDYTVALDLPGQDANKWADDAERRAEWARVVIGK